MQSSSDSRTDCEVALTATTFHTSPPQDWMRLESAGDVPTAPAPEALPGGWYDKQAEPTLIAESYWFEPPAIGGWI